MTNERRAFSIAEFSERWGWGRNTTYKLLDSGKLKSIKVGRRRVITAKQEQEFADKVESEQGI